MKYEERVSTYWPNFAANGKGDITVKQLLSMQVGPLSQNPISANKKIEIQYN